VGEPLTTEEEARLRGSVAWLEGHGKTEWAGREDVTGLLATLDGERARHAALVETAQGYLDAIDAVDEWDEAHGYIVNSERDALHNAVGTARDRLEAILAATPAPAHQHVWVTTFGSGARYEHCAVCGPSISRLVTDAHSASLAATPAPAHLGPDDHGHTGRLWCDPCVAHGVMLEQGVHRCATPAPALEVERPRIVVDEGTPLHLVCGVCGRTRDFSDHDHPSMGHGFIPAGPRPGLCGLPPDGWYCTRGAGHPGPCAARAYEEARNG
jgi:hypothetical protein